MSFFGKIFSKIFPSANAAEVQAAPPAATAAPVPAPIPLGDVPAILDAMPGAAGLNWRTSIVDLLKLLGLDSSLASRKELATEILYSNGEPGSAEWNIGLHKQVLSRIAANGGTLPADLRD